jgi:hypothetical protein
MLKKIIGHAEDERKERVRKFTREDTSQHTSSSNSIKRKRYWFCTLRYVDVWKNGVKVSRVLKTGHRQM